MKRLLAIFFLLVILFNIGGYYLAFWSISLHAKKDLMHRLDADDYDSDDLTILAIPLSLPYPVQQTAYERVDGDFEYQGEYYKLVKQKTENDTLFVVCIKDQQEKKISGNLSAYAKVVNDIPNQSKRTLSLLAKGVTGFSAVTEYKISSHRFVTYENNFGEMTYSVIHKSYPIDSPPPRVLS